MKQFTTWLIQNLQHILGVLFALFGASSWLWIQPKNIEGLMVVAAIIAASYALAVMAVFFPQSVSWLRRSRD